MLFIYGAGGHARVAADAALACGWRIGGFFDDDSTKWGSSLMGAPVLSPEGIEPGEFLPAIGGGALRERTAARLLARGWRMKTVIHPRGCVSPHAQLGLGVFVAAMAVAGPMAKIEDGAIVNHGAVVDHDCWVGPYAHVAPGAVMGGGAQIGARAMLGAGSRLLPLRRIGEDATLGAGAVATRDLAAGAVAVGAPARIAAPRSST